MNENLKKAAIIAVLFAVLVGLIPANIAWAGQLWQTIPTFGPSPTETNTVVPTDISQTATSTPTTKSTSISNSSSTSTPILPPGVKASITPSFTATATPNPDILTTVSPFPTGSMTAGPTSGSIQATTTAQESVKTSGTVPPGFIPTEPTQVVSEYMPVITKDNPSLEKGDSGSNLPIPLILVPVAALLIMFGAILRKFIQSHRKQQ